MFQYSILSRLDLFLFFARELVLDIIIDVRYSSIFQKMNGKGRHELLVYSSNGKVMYGYSNGSELFGASRGFNGELQSRVT